jgi:hypothetical protein
MASPKKKAANKKHTPPLNKKTPASAELVDAIKAKKAEIDAALIPKEAVEAAGGAGTWPKLDPDIVAKAVQEAKSQGFVTYSPASSVSVSGGGAGGGTYSNGTWTFTMGGGGGEGFSVKTTSAATAPAPSSLKHDLATWLHVKWPAFEVEALENSMVNGYDTYDEAVASLKKFMGFSGGDQSERYQWVLQQLQHSHHNTTGMMDAWPAPSEEAVNLLKVDIAGWMASQWPTYTIQKMLDEVLKEGFDTYAEAVATLEKRYKDASKWGGTSAKKYEYVLEKLYASHHAPAGGSLFSPPKPYNIVELIEKYFPPVDPSGHQYNQDTWGSYSHDKVVAKLKQRRDHVKFLKKFDVALKYEAILQEVGPASTAPSPPSVKFKIAPFPPSPEVTPSVSSVEFVPYDGTVMGARNTALSMVQGDCNLVLPMAFHEKMGIYHRHVFLDALRTVIGEGMKHPAQHIHQMKRAQTLLDAAKALTDNVSA